MTNENVVCDRCTAIIPREEGVKLRFEKSYFKYLCKVCAGMKKL